MSEAPEAGAPLTDMPGNDMVNHPAHYNSHPASIECIDVIEHMTFNTGSAIKYLWRAGLKDKALLQDLRKAKWYVEREIDRLVALSKEQPEITVHLNLPAEPADMARAVGQAVKGFR